MFTIVHLFAGLPDPLSCFIGTLEVGVLVTSVTVHDRVYRQLVTVGDHVRHSELDALRIACE